VGSRPLKLDNLPDREADVIALAFVKSLPEKQFLGKSNTF